MEIFKLIAVAVAGLLWLTWLVLRLQEAGVHPARYVLDQYGRLGNGGKIVVLFLVVQMTMFGGAKHGGTNDVDDVTGTNGVEIVEGGTNDVEGVEGETDGGDGLPPLMMARRLQLPSADGSSITEEDLIRGYRLESIVTNADISYAMPSDAVIHGTWHVRGAYEDVMKVDFGGFRFPLGSRLCDSFWVYTWGKVRPQLRDVAREIVSGGFPMAAVPGRSRFWTEDMTNGGYLMTWENFFLDRDTNTSANVQIELCGNGDFTTRFNDIEATYRRIIQPNPITPDNPPDPLNPIISIHPYGPAQNLSVIEETNAYCWVDIVVERADAWVRFEGDGSSNLLDPSFAARAGETNHVIILIGKTYKVTCDMPFSAIAKSDPDIDEWWEDSHTLWIDWPVDIWANGDDDEPPLLLFASSNDSQHPRGFTMYVSPSGLGGGFVWTNSCCSVSGSGYHFSYGCNGDCHCRGCAASGYYGYEGYRLPAWGGSCGCNYEEEPDDPHDDDPDDPAVGDGVVFSERAIIFEDTYEDSPGCTVPRRSTSTTLSVRISGGQHGGTYSFVLTGSGKLIRTSGGEVPSSGTVNAGAIVEYEVGYEAQDESGSADDIRASLTFTENETGNVSSYEDSLTAIRVKFEPRADAPDNGCRGRHKLGVCEVLDCSQYPATPQVTWNAHSGLMQSANEFKCPLDAATDPISASARGVEYVPSIMVVEPSGVEAKDVIEEVFSVATNHAGGIGMVMQLYVLPSDVSFSGIAIEEVPNTTGTHTGYFANSEFQNWWYHTRDRGAGHWLQVDGTNRFGVDRPRLESELYRVTDDGIFIDDPNYGWYDGTLNWANPFGWNESSTTGTATEHKQFATSEQQEMVIFSTGRTGVRKLLNMVTRDIDGKVYLNGIRKR